MAIKLLLLQIIWVSYYGIVIKYLVVYQVQHVFSLSVDDIRDAIDPSVVDDDINDFRVT